jgi:hypothetical protein
MPKARAHRLDADDDILQDGESITVRATLMDDPTRRELRKRHPPNPERICGVTDSLGDDRHAA